MKKLNKNVLNYQVEENEKEINKTKDKAKQMVTKPMDLKTKIKTCSSSSTGITTTATTAESTRCLGATCKPAHNGLSANTMARKMN